MVVIKLVVVLLVAVVFLFFYSCVPSIIEPQDIGKSSGARNYHDFAIETAKKFNPNCYILSHVPSIYFAMGRNSLQTWYGQDKDFMKNLFKKTDCVIFDEGFWCTLEPYRSSVCKHMHDNYNLTVIAQYVDKTSSNTFTFYKVSNPYKD